jgi:hypothetical protein
MQEKRYRNDGAGVRLEFNQTASSASPSAQHLVSFLPLFYCCRAHVKKNPVAVKATPYENTDAARTPEETSRICAARKSILEREYVMNGKKGNEAKAMRNGRNTMRYSNPNALGAR